MSVSKMLNTVALLSLAAGIEWSRVRQARQTVKISAYRMQNLTNNERIATINSQTNPPESPKSLANANYVAAATEMLNSNAREQVALEELAACVGLSTSAIMTVMNGR